MNGQLVEFLAKYQMAASLRNQFMSSLSSYNADMMNTISLLEDSQGPGGSLPGRSANLRRNPQDGHARLMNDYFGPTPVYGEGLFRRRFRMSRAMFIRLVEALGEHDVYFTQRSDALGVIGLSPYQKCTAAIRQLAYGTAADAQDEYLRLGESTAIECLTRFCSGIIRIFGPEYQRRPNEADVRQIQSENAKRGFPGMLGSLDCMHWDWKNCPKALQGHYAGRSGRPTLVLEVVATQNLWIWHSFFGLPGAMNDINVLERSTLFSELSQGIAPPCNFELNGNRYTTGYYLADGIYPRYSTLIQSYSAPATPKLKYFAKCQEAARKDVERAFGVLQARFSVVRGAARLWQPASLALIMNACIILHNMCIEDQGDAEFQEDVILPPRLQRPAGITATFMQQRSAYRSSEAHYAVRNDLIEHLWSRRTTDAEDDGI